MPGLATLLNCMSRRSFSQKKAVKIQFGVVLNQSFAGDELAEPMRDILVYIAREGVSVINLFRRPGNPKETKELIEYLQQGRPFDVTTFSFYALANVVKKYLLQMPGGIFGERNEQQLLKCLDIVDEQERIETMSAVIKSLSPVCKQVTAFLFGIWFRMVYHTEVNGMSLEAIAKSVTGSIFHTCNDDPKKVEHASKCMELLIGNFSSAALFSADLIEYFTQQTKTNISRTEKYCYEFVYPAAVDPNQIESFLRDILAEESTKHGFDYDRDMVSAEEFYGGVLPTPTETESAGAGSSAAVATPSAAVAAAPASVPSPVAAQSIAGSNVTTPTVANNNSGNVMTVPDTNATSPVSPSAEEGVTARRQASIERSRTSVGAAPQFAGPVGTRTSRIDIGIGQDLALRRSKTEYGASVKPVRGTLSSPFNGDGQPLSQSHSFAEAGDSDAASEARRSQLETVDEARQHDRQVAEQRFQSVRQLQLNRLVQRHEWFQSGGADQPAHSTPVTPTTGQPADADGVLQTAQPGQQVSASVERSVSVLSGPAALESQRVNRTRRPSDVESVSEQPAEPALAPAPAPVQDTSAAETSAPPTTTTATATAAGQPSEEAIRRTVAQIPGSETTTVNGECFIKIARFFIVERHYGPDCEQSVQFYQSHFGRSAPQQLSINRHGREPTKLTTVTEVEVTD